MIISVPLGGGLPPLILVMSEYVLTGSCEPNRDKIQCYEQDF